MDTEVMKKFYQSFNKKVLSMFERARNQNNSF